MRNLSDDFSVQAGRLIEAGRQFAARGWVPATSGNFSAQLNDGTLAMTVSGCHKGELTLEDIMRVDLDGRPVGSSKRPSAETLLHTHLYRRYPHLGSVLHVHSAHATVLSRLLQGQLRLSDYEVLKAFPGIDTHAVSLQIPVFPNDQHIPRLAEQVDRYLDDDPNCPGYLIAGHGFYTWGANVADARRHVEAFEFLFECELLQRRMTET